MRLAVINCLSELLSVYQSINYITDHLRVLLQPKFNRLVQQTSDSFIQYNKT